MVDFRGTFPVLLKEGKRANSMSKHFVGNFRLVIRILSACVCKYDQCWVESAFVELCEAFGHSQGGKHIQKMTKAGLA